MEEQDVNVINNRLQEIGKEYQELTALKKQLTKKNKLANLEKEYGEFKFLVKKTVNEEIDFNKLIEENDLKIMKGGYGLLCATYNVGPNQVGYHIARTEEEAEQIRQVQNLFKVGDKVQESVKEGKKFEAQEILDLFEGARNVEEFIGHELEESGEEEEISS